VTRLSRSVSTSITATKTSVGKQLVGNLIATSGPADRHRVLGLVHHAASKASIRGLACSMASLAARRILSISDLSIIGVGGMRCCRHGRGFCLAARSA
jgi:hypothetical protein